MFGQKLTELRKQKNLTQAELAKILGVARTTYSSYEQGRRKPDDEIQKKIADYFGVYHLIFFMDVVTLRKLLKILKRKQ